LFIPKYEIAVYEGAPEVVYSNAPEFVFYYPDKAAALLRLGDLESAIVEGGLDGAPMRDFIWDANPERCEGKAGIVELSSESWGEFWRKRPTDT
jgi:hypothetical protein